MCVAESVERAGEEDDPRLLVEGLLEPNDEEGRGEGKRLYGRRVLVVGFGLCACFDWQFLPSFSSFFPAFIPSSLPPSFLPPSLLPSFTNLGYRFADPAGTARYNYHFSLQIQRGRGDVSSEKDVEEGKSGEEEEEEEEDQGGEGKGEEERRESEGEDHGLEGRREEA